MTSIISFLIIEGTITPCLSGSCGSEHRVALKRRRVTPKLHLVDEQCSLGKLCVLNGDAEKYLDVTCSFFWKQRTITQMLVSPHLSSITFFPKDQNKCEVLFIKKKDQRPHLDGFVAPYLPEGKKQKWGATDAIPPCYKVSNESMIEPSLDGISPEICEELRPLLGYFLQDGETSYVALTCCNNAGFTISRGWLKA